MGMNPAGWGNCTKEDIRLVKNYLSSICPVNSGAHITMSDSTFRRICAVHATRSVSATGNWCSPKRYPENPCLVCGIREAVRSGKAFDPPAGITLAELLEPK